MPDIFALSSTRKKPLSSIVRWHPTAQGWKLNSDGSLFLQFSWWWRYYPKPTWRYDCPGYISSIMAEAQAILDGLLLALSMGCSVIHVESDSLLVIQDLQLPQSHLWEIFYVAARIREISKLIQMTFSHCYRDIAVGVYWERFFLHKVSNSLFCQSLHFT